MLDKSIEYLKGIGPTKATLLNKELGVFTWGQLLEHYPTRYIDRTQFHKIVDIRAEGSLVQLRGILRRVDEQGQGRKKRIIGVFRDDTGMIELVWFKGLNWIKNIQVGVEYIVYGKVSGYGSKFNIVHPEMEPITAKNTKERSSLYPVYPSTEKLSAKGLDTKGMTKVMQNLFKTIHPHRAQIQETLPDYLIEKLRFPNRYTAFLNAHFPRKEAQHRAARNRFKFEEFFFMQLRILQTKHTKKVGTAGFIFDRIGEKFNQFFNENLKFDLTGAQKRVLREIRKDMGNGLQMNRLLQGDVGSGKTVVGFMSMLMALDNRFQTALMAPTEILAQQHFVSIKEMAKGLELNIELLTGTIKGKKRRAILQDLEEGNIDILIGTHALIEDTVKFYNLGLVIIDEQHRFGVMQRAKMWKKNPKRPPHILVMTATPIPRTLAMTVYGDLDVSVIDEMPPGRLPIQTSHKYESQRLWVFGQMRKEIEKGRQVYVVYPLIEESEYEGLADIKNLMEGMEAIEREFPKPQYQISIVHGRQKAEDKDYEMQRFAKGETQIMVATTVIEVGVNVPNATMMVIENSERFGLAQLHQLRGRVGRGGGAAYCILMTGFKLSKEGRFRMQTMVETTDGFKISEADLKLRGPGNMEGTQQSGVLNLKLADIIKDNAILTTARHLAQEILEEDPKLGQEKNQRLKAQLSRSRQKLGFGKIS